MADPNEVKPGPASPAGAGSPPASAPPSAEPPPEPKILRRRLTWAFIWGFLGINFFMTLRFFFPRVLFEPSTVFSIGAPTDFAIGVDTKFQKDQRVWVVRSPDRLFVIFARCTHLGCTPDWKQAEIKFKCPCHGSGFDSEGINFEGPAPRPMDRAHVELDATGSIIVDTGRLYVRDAKAGLDQFDDPNAFLVA